MYMVVPKASLASRTFNALLFVTLASITGFLLPPLIARFIPTDYYYKIENPSPVDKVEYKPGDIVTINLERSSRISQAAEETLELSLVDASSDEDISSERRYINIEEGQRTVRIHYRIPENSREGSYVVRGNIFFRVEGVPRDAGFFTEEFLVATNSGEIQ